MDSIVSAIANASSEEELKELRDGLRAQEEVLFRHAMQLDELAASLAAPAHTLGLVFVLNVRASALAQASSSPLAAAFVQRCRALLLDADRAQVALVPAEFSRLCAKFLTFALPLPQGALLAVKPLLAAATALQPGPSFITPVHPLALQAAILARCYTAVVPMLATPLVQVDVARTAVSAHDVLLLNYHAGIALVGLKRHREAVEAFQLAITAPALVLNSLMVEAYKKWTLCALIATREVPVLPKYTATAVQRNARTSAPAYAELATAFVTRDRAKLAKAIAQHAATFARDNNMGLVKQCETAFLKHCIERLSRTYVTLSLQDIATASGLASAAAAEATILQMVERSELRAQVDRVHGMAVFSADGDALDNAALKADLEARLDVSLALSQRLQALHDELAGDANYIAKTTDKGDRYGGGGGRWAAADRMDDMAVM